MDGKLFTGSHDGCVRIWDATGMTDDTIFGREVYEKEKNQMKEIEKMGGLSLDELDTNQNGINSDAKIMMDDAIPNTDTKIMMEDGQLTTEF